MQGALDRIDQRLDMRNHAGVERDGHGAARRAQAAGQLMAAGDGFVGKCRHPLAQLQFMLRVAYRKAGGNGKCADARSVLEDGVFGGLFIECRNGVATGIVPTG